MINPLCTEVRPHAQKNKSAQTDNDVPSLGHLTDIVDVSNRYVTTCTVATLGNQNICKSLSSRLVFFGLEALFSNLLAQHIIFSCDGYNT